MTLDREKFFRFFCNHSSFPHVTGLMGRNDLPAPLDQDARPMAMDGAIYPVPFSRPLQSPVICFSPVNWHDAARLRPVMMRLARQREVFFLEEPVLSDTEALQIRPCAVTGVQIVTPRLPVAGIEQRRAVLDLLLIRSGAAVGWYATPEARAFSDHVDWLATVDDCAGKLSASGLSSEGWLSGMAERNAAFPPVSLPRFASLTAG